MPSNTKTLSYYRKKWLHIGKGFVGKLYLYSCKAVTRYSKIPVKVTPEKAKYGARTFIPFIQYPVDHVGSLDSPLPLLG